MLKIIWIGLISLLFWTWGNAQKPLAVERIVKGVDGKNYKLNSKLSQGTKKILSLNFTYGYHHNQGKPLIHETLQEVSKKNGWSLTEITDDSKVDYDELKKYKAVIGNNIGYFTNFPKDGQSGLQKYIEEGGGFMIIHATGDGGSSAKWPWYGETLHPVGYGGHGFRVLGYVFETKDATSHPVVEGVFTGASGIAKAKPVFSEYHRFGKNILDENPNAEVLLKVDWERCPGCFPSVSHQHEGGNPIIWTMPVKKGWVGYYVFGHAPDEKESFDDQFGDGAWNKVFSQMLHYISGYDSTEVSTNVDPLLISSGESIRFDPSLMRVGINENGVNTVQLIDIRGKVLEKSTVSGPRVFESQIGKLSRGVYFLRVQIGRKSPEIKMYMKK